VQERASIEIELVEPDLEQAVNLLEGGTARAR